VRIAVNTRLLIDGKFDGIAWFTYETLKRITQSRPNDEFIFIFDRPWNNRFVFGPNVTPVKIGPQSRHPFLWYLWFEQSIPKTLKKYQPDVFLSPDGYLSLSSSVKQLPVIHDINFEHYPKDLPFWYRKYYQHYFPKYAKHATRIATVSAFSKQDIVEKYGIDASKIDVVYNGVSERFKPIVSDTKTAIKQQFSNGKPYFVFVGTLHPRKNIARLISAFNQFKSAGHYPHQLVIVGRKKWWTKDMESALNSSNHKSEIQFHEEVLSEQVAQIVGGSEGLLYVSTFEGFGIPIIEAMRCSVPVITSNVSSMPEVAGESTLLVDPFSVNSIAEQMQRLVNEPGLSENLIEKGNRRSQDFSWDKTAELLWDSVERCIEM
jgi:glycosyltransferase involved in cell wall biosynthesis